MRLFPKGVKVDFGTGFISLLLSGLVSGILSTSIDLSGYELGALINYFWPVFLTIVAMAVFGICCLVFKKTAIRLRLLILLCAYLLYVGFALHFEKEYWPLVSW